MARFLSAEALTIDTCSDDNVEDVHLVDSVALKTKVLACYERLKENVLSFREKGKVVLLGDFNARVGKAPDVDDV